MIKPGMELKIPPGDGVLHKVKSGDTLSDLAEKYDASEQAIADINWIDPPFNLNEGEMLFVPDGTMPPPPEPDPEPVVASTPSPSSNSGSSGGGTGNYVPSPSGSRFLNWPVAGGAGRVTQCFSGWHNGVDIADSSWPNLVAASSGTVTFAGCQSGSCPSPGSSVGGYGLAWTVIIDHGNGYSTIYGHLNNIYVSSGQYVSAGTAIGQMGQSGTATGVHLHFMVVRSGTWSALNPARFMTTHICGY
jgi:murein DD-endopeptidase MepM/ murein hydrolase activator NlpD